MAEGLGFGAIGPAERLLLRVVELVSSGLELDPLVAGVAALTNDATETDVCCVYLLGSEGRRVQLAGATPPFDELVGQVTYHLNEGVHGWVAAHGEPVVRSGDEPGRTDYAAMAVVPIKRRPSGVVGVLDVKSRAPREFGPRDLQLLNSIGNLVAGAIDNARLHDQLREREKELARFAERTVTLQEHERRRVAGDIHDGISERIVGLAFHLSAAADAMPGSGVAGGGPQGGQRADLAFVETQIRAARELASGALDEARRAIAGLRPAVLDDLGLVAGLESLTRSVAGIEVDLQVDDIGALPDHVETALYRIAQEALQNVVKHAQAQRARLELGLVAGCLVLKIRDDGRGFPADAAGDDSGYGLSGMRERADLIGGRLHVRTRRGTGTTIKVSVRLPALHM